ncbi:MAG: glycosyltransferase family 2 protein [Bifidobacterium crudilactis]|jgi:glycosyltransferase involved in cell wall biosynthesis|uniref:Glycosyltransferase family 2 protein n=2 Tax=Bifidobacterium crudilactis TaxID=327277 RepID=A0A971IDH0_9BIFI|nr:glycosyltransferase family 2 protein [Bifidobacterium crudilactis]MCI1868775.1 glycosyltransferase family 2 protein [Bifidobacterium crudilactis]MDN5972865.1 glycosyltransferase family 2 protein [Bifidobacterium crudilactis]MDN6000717.1 glycosyltransferase family 2 protein [Bifidobacterium crudilactis]MDN6209849.1 glycosyltransferase family 2 protein [Bifidobacterium crudilactis]MDN6234450.1 glycosyltransferase family 2 protein [Bifidobacterium crudilactis]
MATAVDHYVTHTRITLSFIVPAYNVAEYIGRCVSSLLSSHAADVEIVIVDDGSTDETGIIADQYALANPGLLKVIHQSNQGHGGAINTGLAHATGAYVKIIDADDWVDPSSLITVLSVLREQLRQGSAVDLVVTNYVYEKQNKHFKHVVRYDNVMPAGRKLSWDDIGSFRTNQYLIMHSLIFKTSVIQRSRMQLPHHTFYVDFIFSYQPLPSTTTLLYVDTNLYRYFTGRQGQSVETKTMVSRVNQLMRVNQIMTRLTPEPDSVPMGLYRYMIHYLSINCVITSTFLILSKERENYRIKQHLWQQLESRSPAIAEDVRSTTLCRLINIPGRTGRLVVRCGYRIAEAAIGFN